MPRWRYNGIFVLRSWLCSWLHCNAVMASPPHKWHRALNTHTKDCAFFFFSNTSLVMITWQHSPPQSSLIESSSSPRKGPTRRYEHSTISFSFFSFSFLPRTTLPHTFLPVPDWSLHSNGMHSTKTSFQYQLHFQRANQLSQFQPFVQWPHV